MAWRSTPAQCAAVVSHLRNPNTGSSGNVKLRHNFYFICRSEIAPVQDGLRKDWTVSASALKSVYFSSFRYQGSPAPSSRLTTFPCIKSST